MEINILNKDYVNTYWRMACRQKLRTTSYVLFQNKLKLKMSFVKGVVLIRYFFESTIFTKVIIKTRKEILTLRDKSSVTKISQVKYFDSFLFVQDVNFLIVC